MPYISTTTNVKLSKEAVANLQRRMGEAIAIIPGKSEENLMLSWQDQVPMAFRGDDSPCAVCQVQVFGGGPADSYDRLTDALTAMLEDEAGIPANRVYVNYQEMPAWGCGKGNF